MQISLRVKGESIGAEGQERLEQKFAGIERMLGEESFAAHLELDLERAPAQGRSAEPYKLIANLSFGKHVLHGEAVKPTPESAADRVRSELDHEIRRVRGKGLVRRTGAAVKNFFRFGN
jgi:ribosome-associated translation inhibitor RaiA